MSSNSARIASLSTFDLACATKAIARTMSGMMLKSGFSLLNANYVALADAYAEYEAAYKARGCDMQALNDVWEGN